MSYTIFKRVFFVYYVLLPISFISLKCKSAGTEDATLEEESPVQDSSSIQDASSSPVFSVHLPTSDANTLVPVDKAGTLIIRKGTHGKKHVILGLDRQSVKQGRPYAAWFSGDISKTKDQDYRATIIRETCEETADLLKLSKQDIQNAMNEKRFFYGTSCRPSNAKPKGILAIVYPDTQGKYSAKALNKQLHAILHDTKFSSEYKEVESYHEVALDDFVEKVRKCNNTKAFCLKTTKGLSIRIQSNHAEILIQDADKTIEAIEKAAAQLN